MSDREFTCKRIRKMLLEAPADDRKILKAAFEYELAIISMILDDDFPTDEVPTKAWTDVERFGRHLKDLYS